MVGFSKGLKHGKRPRWAASTTSRFFPDFARGKFRVQLYRPSISYRIRPNANKTSLAGALGS